MKISVIWTWYIWLIQAVWLSKIWLDIVSIDVFQDKIDKLKSWISTIYEDWLDELLSQTYKNINFTTNTKEITWSDVIFICVWTPQDNDWKTDLWYIFQATKDIKPYLNWSEIIVIKSTVPVWTNKKVSELLDGKNKIVSNPEFLREWLAINDFFNPDRIVLGFENKFDNDTKNKMLEVYEYFTKKWVEIFTTDWQTSELIKYAANSFLATKITFINEISRLSDKVWANIKDIATAIWMDDRIGKKFLNAWIWYWWSCFPKDVKSLVNQFKENWLSWDIITNVDKTNSSQVWYFLDKIFDYYSWDLHSKTIWILWVAFKPDTDDLRESKWIEIINKLMHAWAKIKVYDYNKKALENFRKYLDWIILSNSRWFFEVTIVNDFESLVKDSDSLVITLEDKRILEENFENIKLNDSIIFDGKNILNREKINELWIKYIWVGY